MRCAGPGRTGGGDPGRLSRAQRLRRDQAPVPGHGHGRRPGRLGRGGHHVPEASRATAAVIEGFGELLAGRDPRDTGALWRAMKEHAWWYGYGGGITSFAVAAVDIALWDIKGQAL